MTVACYPLDAVTGSPEYTGRMLRDTLAALVGGASSSRPLGAFSGVRPGTPSTTVTLSGLNWTCEPHAGVLDKQAAAEAGPYLYAVTVDETGTLNAQAVGNARSDLLVAQLSDPAEGDGTSVPEVEIVYVPGTAGPGAPDPSVPARSMVLARFNVPQSGGGSPTVTWLAPTLFAAGANPVVATQAALTDLAAVAFEGMEATVLATPGATWRYTSSAWVMHGIARFADASARTAAITTPAQGMLTRLVDLQRVEEYSAIYHSSTNLAGRDTAGWYPVAVDIARKYSDSITVTAVANGSTVKARAFKRRPYKQRIFITLATSIAGASAGVGGVAMAASSGGTIIMAGALQVAVTTSGVSFCVVAEVEIAAGAGTDVTITFTTNSTVNQTMGGSVRWEVAVEGEW